MFIQAIMQLHIVSILYSLLLINRQTAQLVCQGCKINNSAVYVTINKSTYTCIQMGNKRLQYACVTIKLAIVHIL